MKVFAQHRTRTLKNGSPYKRYFTELQWKLLPKEKDGSRGGWFQIKPEPPSLTKKVSKPTPLKGDIDATRGAISLADKYSIDLTNVKGSGDDGRILKSDVQDIIDNK